MNTAVRLAALSLVLTACHPKHEDDRHPGASVTCPDGGLRPQIDCRTDLGLRQRVVDANASFGQLGLGASYTEGAVGQVTDSTYQLALRLESLCQDYNACAIEPERYTAQAQDIRTRLSSHVGMVTDYAAAVEPELGDTIWANAVPELAAQRLTLEYQLQALRSGAPPAVVHRDGEPLTSGDSFRVVVQPSQTAYVYILLMSSQGEPGQLFPLADMGLRNPIQGGQRVQIPPDGTFELDAHAGEESLQILVSTRPLADIEARMQALAGGGDPPAAAREGVLQTVGDLLCARTGKRGITYKKVTAACEGAVTRGILYKKAATPRAAATPGDDVIVVQHRIDHR